MLMHLLPQPPSQNIRRLSLTQTPEAGAELIRNILESLPNIEYLAIAYSDPSGLEEDEDEMEDDGVVLPNLTFLEISIYAYSVFKFLTLPALDTCVINSSPTNDRLLDYMDYILRNEFWVDLLARSSDKLQRIRIALDCNIDEETEVAYLQALHYAQNLRHLEIGRRYMSFDYDNLQELFDQLVDAPPDQFLTQLQTVDVHLTCTRAETLDPYGHAMYHRRLARPGVQTTLYCNGAPEV
jgi:hypothetical protein